MSEKIKVTSPEGWSWEGLTFEQALAISDRGAKGVREALPTPLVEEIPEPNHQQQHAILQDRLEYLGKPCLGCGGEATRGCHYDGSGQVCGEPLCKGCHHDADLRRHRPTTVLEQAADEDCLRLLNDQRDTNLG